MYLETEREEGGRNRGREGRREGDGQTDEMGAVREREREREGDEVGGRGGVELAASLLGWGR